MAPRAQLREVGVSQFEQAFTKQPAKERDRCRELVVKRGLVVEVAIKCLR